MPLKRAIRLFPWRRQPVSGEQLPKRYAKSPEGRAIIRLALASPEALLMPFESFPARFGKAVEDADNPPVVNLNKELVDYLFARLGELGDEELLLRISLPAGAISMPKQGQTEPAESLPHLEIAIQRYFAYLESTRRQNLTQLARDALLLGVLGTGALGLSVLIDERGVIPSEGIGLPLLNQGVTIFGWLTCWEALANALWNWRPLYQHLRMSQRLQAAKIEIAVI
ncbi:MAG: hypothetical protein DCF25_18045 [Leptolyngbya foveolarum]|uniref:Uncharacterized protein n=1 Tax=Leptolyngbya foveolarum TaxID=47253 RepID=A0A2W4VZF7_9CYAN|nr:MAG: hypothetical protein DCF25_18045 [Leptolyngbya foveolarum]